MILELGAELISSDAVALYELVKNAVDAGSDRVCISIQLTLKHSHYVEAMEALDEGDSLDVIRRRLLAGLESGAPEGAQDTFRQTIAATGDSRQQFRSALSKLCNDQNWIEVKDHGHGMSGEELEAVFLTIGTRSRRAQKVNAEGRFQKPERTILGDKGVGRLSAMRLGDRMLVTTTRSGDAYENVLEIDWTLFSHESAAMIQDIDLRPCRGAVKADAARSGTSILIRGLRADWDAGVFRRLVEEQFKRIVDPFPSSRSMQGWRDPNKLFLLLFNGQPYQVPEIPVWLLEQAHAVVTAEYKISSDGTASLSGSIDYKLRNRETQFQLGEAELLSIADPIADRTIRTGRKAVRGLGPFSVRFYWYNRRLLKEVPGIGKRSDIMRTVNSWAGGLMVFRDFFRINPYGGQEDDWLELDKRALAARAYKVNRSQLIGQVNLSSRNWRLTEQTNREGLVGNEYKQVLIGVLRHILITEFRSFIERVDKQRRVSDETTTDDLDQRVAQANLSIEAKIGLLKREMPAHKEVLEELQELAMNLARLVDQAKAIAKEYEDDRSKFVYLAGIGLMVEFVLHELGRATGRALDVLRGIDVRQIGESGAAAMGTLRDQLITLGKRVDALDPLSTSRRQTKERFDLLDLVREVVEGRKEQLQRHGIHIGLQLPRQVFKLRAVKGMVLQIIENLLENAIYWLKIEGRRQPGFGPQIELEVDATSHEFVFRDNGPGVDLERAESIFEPFVTSKPPGQGKGLGLYISREMARYHGWELRLAVDDTPESSRSSTFVLEMGRGS